ncbi:MAG: hypothetical protein U0835_26430 [Isosphaeraceae bacterium]
MPSARTRTSLVNPETTTRGISANVNAEPAMNAVPRANVAQPAGRGRRSPAPIARPTRTAPADARPSGTMNVTLATFNTI